MSSIRLKVVDAIATALATATGLTVFVLFAFGKTPEADCDPYECEIHAALMASPIFGGVTVLMERLGGMWTFDLGDCAARTLNYRFGYRTSVTSLEA